MARRKVEVFSLSFLDVICCGFGAVILFYTIISAQSGVERTRKAEDLSAQVAKLEEEVITGARNLVLLRNTLQKTESETVSATSRATQLIEELQRKREESFIYDAETLAKRERIEKLKADVKALEENSRRLEASAKVATPRGELTGAGKSRVSRRYITGLTLKGRRILVLLDRSASMLDEDLVNIIRLRNSPPAAQITAQKWRRATDIATWIIGEIPDGAQYQVYGFNTGATPLLEGTAGEWIRGNDEASRDKLQEAVGRLAPVGGTSLINAFAAIRGMKVPPDQVILITDGLPTQGATAPALRRFVDAGDRARLFDEAVRGINKNVPVDVILLPMKGDVPAPHRFWGLARLTKGAFVMPSPDWP
ncbi:MAG: VWA domain-containing protein [Gammaproteobacteria bacterium]|nr:VWA domain-containing protein [Gammaproteobacteria bacterium]